MEDLTPASLGARLSHMRAQLSRERNEAITQRQIAQALAVKPQAYNVLLLRTDGSTQVWRAYPGA